VKNEATRLTQNSGGYLANPDFRTFNQYKLWVLGNLNGVQSWISRNRILFGNSCCEFARRCCKRFKRWLT
jgi:hypothetical protein